MGRPSEAERRWGAGEVGRWLIVRRQVARAQSGGFPGRCMFRVAVDDHFASGPVEPCMQFW